MTVRRSASGSTGKSAAAYRTITEVAAQLDIPQHVLRFWESRFPQLRPVKHRGGRRYYRPQDIELVARIRELLHERGYTIKGARMALREEGLAVERAADVAPPPPTTPVTSPPNTPPSPPTQATLDLGFPPADPVVPSPAGVAPRVNTKTGEALRSALEELRSIRQDIVKASS